MSPEELKRISTQTLAHYEGNAQALWQGTKDHDVRQNRAALAGQCLEQASVLIYLSRLVSQRIERQQGLTMKALYQRHVCDGIFTKHQTHI